jgi:hypothetical protein
MLTADLPVVSNHASLTLPGSAASTVFAQITGPIGQKIVRRVAATANTTPQTLSVGHTVSGTGFAQRIRSLIRMDYQALNTDIADTGGVTPSAACYLVFDRPVQSGGAITDAIFTTMLGGLCDVVLTSGALTKLLNQEA